MATIGIKEIDGMRGLQKKLKALGPATGGKFLRSATNLAMKNIVKPAAENAIPVNDRDYAVKTYKGRPVLPGFAKRSITVRSKLSRDKTTAWSWVGVKAEAYYAVNFVEFGTSKQKRQPWLEPALRENAQKVISDQSRRLKQKIEKEAKKRR